MRDASSSCTNRLSLQDNTERLYGVMTHLDRATRMPARALLYGFLGFIAVAGAVTMLSDPLDPTIGDGSASPADWSDSKLRTYLSDVRKS